MNRRNFLSSAATLVAVPLVVGAQTTPPAHKMRIILLGTGGGPGPKRTRSAPASVVVVNNAAYIVDCGNGVARQLVLADVALNSIHHVLITHHHSDHNADYGTLLLLAWNVGLRTPVDTWGPPPLARITDLFLEMSAPEINVRMMDQGFPPLRPLIQPHELTEGGVVLKDGNVTVTSAVVHHPMVPLAFAYRFDGPDRSVVFSGDTTKSDALIALAKGADILVHEALYADLYRTSSGHSHILDSHTPVEDVSRVAAEAGVKTLVLNHFVPDNDPRAEPAWLPAARSHFSGEVILGRDLLEL